MLVADHSRVVGTAYMAVGSQRLYRRTPDGRDDYLCWMCEAWHHRETNVRIPEKDKRVPTLADWRTLLVSQLGQGPRWRELIEEVMPPEMLEQLKAQA